MSNDKNKRRFKIDVAKFFAIIFMVFIHVYEEMALLGSRIWLSKWKARRRVLSGSKKCRTKITAS